jgi:TIR domain
MQSWDFFVSFTRSDRSWAEWVAWQLEDLRYRVLLEPWDFVGGSNWIGAMQAGITRSERTIAVLSSAYLDARYAAAEWQAAWAADPMGAERKLLVVRVSPCDRPGLLGGVVSVDLFDKSEPLAKMELHRMVDGALAGRAKPSQPPPFPGASPDGRP